MPDRVGLAEIAELLGVHKQTAFPNRLPLHAAVRLPAARRAARERTGLEASRHRALGESEAAAPNRQAEAHEWLTGFERNLIDLQDRSLIERRLVGAIRSAIHAHGPVTLETAPSAERAYSALEQIAREQRQSADEHENE